MASNTSSLLLHSPAFCNHDKHEVKVLSLEPTVSLTGSLAEQAFKVNELQPKDPPSNSVLVVLPSWSPTRCKTV